MVAVEFMCEQLSGVGVGVGGSGGGASGEGGGGGGEGVTAAAAVPIQYDVPLALLCLQRLRHVCATEDESVRFNALVRACERTRPQLMSAAKKLGVGLITKFEADDSDVTVAEAQSFLGTAAAEVATTATTTTTTRNIDEMDTDDDDEDDGNANDAKNDKNARAPTGPPPTMSPDDVETDDEEQM